MRNIVVTVAMLAACGSAEGAKDLSTAVDGGIGRFITQPPQSIQSGVWRDVREVGIGNDTLVQMPRSICWLGTRLLVAESAHQQIQLFDANGFHIDSWGRKGEGPGEFRRLLTVRCSDNGAMVLAVDPGNGRVNFINDSGEYLYAIPLPPVPQGIPYSGEFAVKNDGTWFDSWLAAGTGPYLVGDEWNTVRVVRHWSADGELLGEFGAPFEYDHPVLKRVFNVPDFSLLHDTLWVLSQGNAAVRGFDAGGTEVGTRMFLPFYYRGIEPFIQVKGSRFPGGYRSNKAYYDRNVAGLSGFDDSLFVTVRYQDYRWISEGEGEAESRDRWPSSSLEVFDRGGRIIRAVTAPGRVTALSVQRGDGPIAILTQDEDTHVRTVMILERFP